MPHRLPSLKLPRLGLASRLIVTVLLLLFVAIGMSGGLTFLARTTDPASRFPIADQIGAIHALVQRTPAADRPLVLRAVSSTGFEIRVVTERPARSPTDIPLPGVEWLIANYLETLGAHEVFATFSSSGRTRFARFLARISPNSEDDLSIVISLAPRDYLVVALKGSPAARFWGMPVGFWLGSIGTLIAAVVIIAIMREARPIEALAGSVAAFARDATPRPVAPAGAPEIRTLIEASNAMQSRIAALLKGRTIMLGAVSHDLKTFLTRLRLRVEMVDDDALRRKAVGDIEDMDRMIDDALALARGTVGDGRREPVDLAALVAADIEARATTRHRITTRFAPGSTIVSGDQVALRRVVANLIENAVHYGRGEVVVGLKPLDGGCRLVIDDDGPGIPEAERRAVFEPFYRLEASRNRGTGGSGLGLAIVHDLVLSHGGTIAIESAPSGGARVVVTLPLASSS